MEKGKNRKIFWKVHWMLSLFCCIGLLYGRTVTVHAGTRMEVTDLHQTNAGGDYVHIEWSMDINADEYEIQYSADGRNWSSSYYEVYNRHSVSKLNCGSTYQVRVRCVGRGRSETSPWATLEVITAPKQMDDNDIKQVTATQNSITVNWTPADGASYYEVFYELPGYNGEREDHGLSAGTTTACSYTIKDLNMDECYYIHVKAVRKAKTGYENFIYYGEGHECFTTAAKVTGCTLEKWDTSKNQVTLSWELCTRDFPSGSGYQIYVYNLSGKKVQSVKADSPYESKTFKLSSSLKNQGFIFRVRNYRNVDGKSIYGPWSSKKTVVAQPRVTLKKSGGKSIQLSWKKVKGAASYTVYRRAGWGGVDKKIKTVKGTKYTDKLSNSNVYYYVVANGVKVNGKSCKFTKAMERELASYSGKKTVYIWE